MVTITETIPEMDNMDKMVVLDIQQEMAENTADKERGHMRDENTLQMDENIPNMGAENTLPMAENTLPMAVNTLPMAENTLPMAMNTHLHLKGRMLIYSMN